MIKLELLKIYRERTIYILSLCLAILLLTPFLLGSNEFNLLKMYEDNYKTTNDSIKSIENVPEAQSTVQDMKESNEYLEKLITAIKSDDKKEALENELKFENKNLIDMESGKLQGGSILDQKSKVELLSYLKNNNLLKISTDSKSLGASNYLSMILSTQEIVMIILIIIGFQIVYLFNLDYRKNNFIIYSLSPRSYLQIFFSKFSAILLSVLLNSFVIFSLVLLIVSIKNGIGILNYPIVTLQNNQSVNIITTSTYINKILLFLFMFIIFQCFIALLLSIVTGNMIISIVIIILPILLGQYNILNTYIKEDLKPFIILSYIDISYVISGGNSITPLTNPNINFNNGLVVILSSILLCLFLAVALLIKFPKKFVFNKFTN